MRQFLATSAALALLAGAASAEDVAYVVGNDDYSVLADMPAASGVESAVAALKRAGFTVYTTLNGEARDLRDQAQGVAEADLGRRVFLLAGHFAHSASETWLLGTEASRPSATSAQAMGLPLSQVLDLAAQAPGGAVVLLADERATPRLGTGLTAGLGEIVPPQGVTVVVADTPQVAALARGDMLKPGLSYADVVARNEGVRFLGYLSPFHGLMPGAVQAPPVAQPAPKPPVVADPLAADRAAFDAAKARNTRASYEAYLTKYPRGTYAEAARAAIARIDAQPLLQGEAEEQALGLSRDQRKQVQADLTLLGHDTRGVDGAFGAGTRAAIKAWQGKNRYPATGYLTAAQLRDIAAQAEQRRAEIARDKAAEQAAIDKADRQYWADMGAGEDEAGTRAYLKRYPNGIYADFARQKLGAVDGARDASEWEKAAAANTVEAYRAYLRAFPDGAQAETARKRIAAMTAQDSAAETAEKRLGLDGITKSLVEGRLEAMGMKPGRVDGVFDAETRAAIRRYQEARGLPATGYLSQQVLMRLLADAF